MSEEQSLTREALIEAVKIAGAKNGGYLSHTDFKRLTGISQNQLYRLFPEQGCWSTVLQLAGVAEHPKTNKRKDNDEILSEMHKVFESLKSIPPTHVFRKHANVSPDLVKKRFGSWRKAWAKYAAWLKGVDPHSSLLPAIEEEFGANPSVHLDKVKATPNKPVVESHYLHNASASAIIYGELINFRGLQHAPVNEQGVVYLFGMVSFDLGFLIEAVQSGFPDCQGKRRIKGNRWVPVRIEFEYRSRTFREHAHDPNGCDVIVCWEHNWPECPLEVIELKTMLKELNPQINQSHLP